jgi:hypothetical protein
MDRYQHRTRITEDARDETQRHDFGVRDSKGRVLGANVATGRRVFEAAQVGNGSWWTLAPGTHFYFCPQATRDGRGFGATQGARYFATAAERDAAVARYLDSARKRAAKVQP